MKQEHKQSADKQVFQNFTDATAALLAAPSTPKELREASAEAVNEVGSQLGGLDDLSEAGAARETLSRILNLREANGEQRPEEAEGEAHPGPELQHHKEIVAEAFKLVDSEGNPRAYLTAEGDHTILAMYDHRGHRRLTLRASEREAHLSVLGEHISQHQDDDTITRVQIGYEPDFKGEPRIVISDGKENECVLLSIDGDGAGVVEINGPSGRSTYINETGLVLLDRDGETLAKYDAQDEDSAVEDRPAAAISTAPTRDTVNEAAIRGLVEGCLQARRRQSRESLHLAYSRDRLQR